MGRCAAHSGRRAGLPAVAVRVHAARAGLAALLFGREQFEARGSDRGESARAAEPGHPRQPLRHRAHRLRRGPLQQGDRRLSARAFLLFLLLLLLLLPLHIADMRRRGSERSRVLFSPIVSEGLELN